MRQKHILRIPEGAAVSDDRGRAAVSWHCRILSDLTRLDSAACSQSGIHTSSKISENLVVMSGGVQLILT